jgi:dihydroorotase (EC 3.5.2.3)
MTTEIPQNLTLIKPDDWHIHLRDGQALKTTVPHAATHFARAIAMPNLVPPVTNAEQALSYKARIIAARPPGSQFEPLMVLYLTDLTSSKDIRDAHAAGVVACKLYPAGATTNSDSGVTDIRNIYPALETMQELGVKFLIHGEVTDNNIDIFDREAVFLERTLQTIVTDFPALKVVLEHITTADAAAFVQESGPNVAATITAHHLLFNRNHMLAGGIRPHYYCLPILKRSTHQAALIEAATSGSPKFFLGTDSAPHARQKKEAACGCAGAYTAFTPLELYAEAFEDAGALDKLEGFASLYGPAFYGLAPNTTKVTLHRLSWRVPETLAYCDETLVPLRAGETLRWKLI